jgi:hypothetical protein
MSDAYPKSGALGPAGRSFWRARSRLHDCSRFADGKDAGGRRFMPTGCSGSPPAKVVDVS